MTKKTCLCLQCQRNCPETIHPCKAVSHNALPGSGRPLLIKKAVATRFLWLSQRSWLQWPLLKIHGSSIILPEEQMSNFPPRVPPERPGFLTAWLALFLEVQAAMKRRGSYLVGKESREIPLAPQCDEIKKWEGRKHRYQLLEQLLPGVSDLLSCTLASHLLLNMEEQAAKSGKFTGSPQSYIYCICLHQLFK